MTRYIRLNQSAVDILLMLRASATFAIIAVLLGMAMLYLHDSPYVRFGPYDAVFAGRPLETWLAYCLCMVTLATLQAVSAAIDSYAQPHVDTILYSGPKVRTVAGMPRSTFLGVHAWYQTCIHLAEIVHVLALWTRLDFALASVCGSLCVTVGSAHEWTHTKKFYPLRNKQSNDLGWIANWSDSDSDSDSDTDSESDVPLATAVDC